MKNFGKNNQGYTLLEVLVAIVMIGLVTSMSTQAVLTNLKGNKHAQTRYEAAQAAQTVIDEIRYREVATLPTSGSDDAVIINFDGKRDYSVVATYCPSGSSYCTGASHIRLDVSHRNEVIYSTETVFTDLGSADGGTSTSSSSSGGSASSSSSSGSGSSTSLPPDLSSTSSTSSSSSSTSASSSSTSASSSSTSASSSSGSRRRRRGGRRFRR